MCCCTLTVTKSHEVSKQQSNAWSHREKGRLFLCLSNFVAHAIPAPPAWLGKGMQVSHLIQHHSPNLTFLPTITYLPGFPLERSYPSAISQYQISSSLSTATVFCCWPCPSKIIVLGHSSMGFNLLPMSLLPFSWRPENPPMTPFIGILILLPA